MQAIGSPVWKLTVMAGAALAVGAYVAPKHHGAMHHRLVLHAPVQEHAIYLSAWMDGREVSYELDTANLEPIEFDVRASISDGCEWLGTEKLTPDGNRFAYSYDETILSCEPGATPALKTPRTGFVTVDQ